MFSCKMKKKIPSYQNPPNASTVAQTTTQNSRSRRKNNQHQPPKKQPPQLKRLKDRGREKKQEMEGD